MNVEEHEQKIREINKRILNGEKVDVQKEISRLLGEDNLGYRLRTRLDEQINGRISMKAKEFLSEREYFLKRDDLENQLIQSGFPYAFFQNEATLEEIEQLRLDKINPKVLMLCVISALRTYIDNEQETDPKCVVLHSLYLQLKEELRSILPFQSECEDGFTEYLASKSERTELQNARQTGNVCIVCGSREIHSKGKEWICENGHRFRKH